jgi:hypothetical protein
MVKEKKQKENSYRGSGKKVRKKNLNRIGLFSPL